MRASAQARKPSLVGVESRASRNPSQFDTARFSSQLILVPRPSSSSALV